MASRMYGSRGRRVHLLHVEDDELLLLGFRSAAPSEWVITSLRSDEGRPLPPVDAAWDATLLGVGDDAGSVRAALSSLLRLHRVGCPVIAWLPAGAARYMPALRALGVAGFISRSAPVRQLQNAILEVIEGEVVVDHRLRAGLHEYVDGAGSLGLSEIQQRVAALYVLHGNRRLVARDLHVSENTVKYHLRRIYATTGTSSVHELHKLLLSRGWSRPERPGGPPHEDGSHRDGSARRRRQRRGDGS